MMQSFNVLDTHTGGEVTRVVLASDLGLDKLPLQQQLQRLRGPLDWVRVALTSEPRGNPFAVGAIVTLPTPSPQSLHADSKTLHAERGAVIFFNNVGYLGMCGHGLIGVVEALRYRGAIQPGRHLFHTPPGPVVAELGTDGEISFAMEESFCHAVDVVVNLEDGQSITGDIAYGGNWFFLCDDEKLAQQSVATLMQRCRQIRQGIERQHIRGSDGAIIDHIELC